MVIGIFNDTFPPIPDGVANVVSNYAIYLSKIGHTVYVVTGEYRSGQKGKSVSKENGFTVYRFPVHTTEFSKPYGILKWTKADYDELIKIQFDLIHIHCPFYTGRLGRKIAKFKNIPLVGTIHSQLYMDLLASTKSKVLSRSILKLIMKEYNYCDVLWAVSKGVSDVYSKSPYNIKKDIRVMDNGCDIIPLSDDEASNYKKDICEKYNIKSDVPMFLFVGQHHDKKNIPLILSALNLLKKQGIEFKMLFVGDGPHKEKYENYVKKNGLINDVIFIGEVNDRRKLASLYASAYLLLFPSYYDSSCLVKREAACFKVPTLFGKGAATACDIQDKVNGYLTENNAESMAEVITYAISNKEERDRVGEEAYKTLYVSWEAIVQSVVNEYEKIITSYSAINEK